MEGRNPPLPLNFVTSTRLPDDRSCSTEEKPDDRPLLPPNYVSLRELRERRLKEEQERERRREGRKASEGADRRHPSYITVRELEEELLREAKEKEGKGNGDGRGGESGDRAPLPRDYVSLKQLQAQRLKKGKGKDQKGAKEKGDDSGKTEKKINRKLCDGARNLRSKEAGWVWEPKLLAAGSSTDISSVEPMVSAENAGASHEDSTVSSDQNGAPQINWKDEKKKKKKKKKKKNWKRASGKGKHEPALNTEQPLEVTSGKIAEAPKASSKAPEEMTLSQNGNNTVRKLKGENKNTNEASSQLVPVLGEVKRLKRLNGTRSRRIKAQKGGNRMKSKEANLPGPCRNVVSMSEVEKGFDGVKEATGTEIETGKELKGKGKMFNILESIDQISSHEEAKEGHDVGDLIGSEIGSGEVKGRSRNVSLSELSETGGQLGDHWWKWNQAAGSRGRGRPRAGRFSVRPAERLSGGGGLVWVPKNGS